MAIIRPFRAWRFNKKNLEEAHQEGFLNKDAFSPEQLAEKLEHWKETGELQQDPMPGIYICYQTYSPFGDEQKHTWKGFISMIRLSAPDQEDNGGIQMLLQSLPTDYQEQLARLESTLMHTVPARGMYEDPGKTLEAIMDHYMETPAIEYTDEQGVEYKLAIVQQREDIELFIQALKSRKIPFGNSIHQLAASRALRKKWLDQEKELPADSMVNYVPMYCSNLFSPDAVAYSRAINENLKKKDPATPFYPEFPTGLLFASINDTENDTPFDTCFQITQAPTTT